MATRFAHSNIIAKDWRKLAAFYTEVFDCVYQPPERNQSGQWLEDATNVKNAELQGVHLLLPGHGKNGPTLEIFSYKNSIAGPESVANLTGFGHIAFEVDDVTASLRKIISYGGSNLGKIVSKQIQGAGLIVFTYAKDPEGNIIELQNWTKHPA